MSAAPLIVNLRKSLITTSARKVWHHLNGIINVYKPAGVSTGRVKQMIRTHICDGKYCMLHFDCYFIQSFIHSFNCVELDLNSMDPDDTPRVVINYENEKYSVTTVKDSALLDKTIGPRYIQKEVRCNSANYHGLNTSGVLGKRKSINKFRRKCSLFAIEQFQCWA